MPLFRMFAVLIGLVAIAAGCGNGEARGGSELESGEDQGDGAAPGEGEDSGDSAEDSGVQSELDGQQAGESDGDGESSADVSVALPSLGELLPGEPLCAGAPPGPLPEAFWGANGLGAVGYSAEDLINAVAWNLPSRFMMPWISDNTNAAPSLRVRPHLAPDFAACYLRSVKAGASVSPGALATFVRELGAVFDSAGGPQAIRPWAISGPGPGDVIDELGALSGSLAAAAYRGLWEMDNPLQSANSDEAQSPDFMAADAALSFRFGPKVDRALAELLLAIGEAALAVDKALGSERYEQWRLIHAAYLAEKYFPAISATWAFMSPVGNNAPALTLEVGDEIDRRWLVASAERLIRSTEELVSALHAEPAIAAPRLRLPTPLGDLVFDTDGGDDDYAAGELEGAALVVDTGGNDIYRGRVASTTVFEMGAAVLIDLDGDDRYGPDAADVAQPKVSSPVALDPSHGFTQGFGLFGIALLYDEAGDDEYRASVHAQGAGAFGVGLLIDRAGNDVYRAALLSQGLGTFGLGVLVDNLGDDDYALFALGQGTGRPAGHGLLLDVGGDDLYLALYNDDPPELASPGYPNVHGTASGYSDSSGQVHYINAARGVGWGYRGDWNSPQVNWAGGFGAFVDLGEGRDAHFADCLSIGQGFVYGHGLFYDGGGDDFYRAFWWAYGSGTHMGVGLFWEDGGDDDYFATRASATLGHDTGVSWFFDASGNDLYGGALNFGRSLTNGLAFFFDLAGDDVYAIPTGAAEDPLLSQFGAVHDAAQNLKRVGVFMDLGGGNDEYMTARPDVGNDKAWITPPTGPQPNPALHIGIGLDE